MSEEIVLSVPAMACCSCVSKIEDALKRHVDAERIKVDFDRKRVSVITAIPVSKLITLISSAGYAAEQI